MPEAATLQQIKEDLAKIAGAPWRTVVDENGTPGIINGWNVDDNTMALTCYADEHTIRFIANAPAYMQQLVDQADRMEAYRNEIAPPVTAGNPPAGMILLGLYLVLLAAATVGVVQTILTG